MPALAELVPALISLIVAAGAGTGFAGFFARIFRNRADRVEKEVIGALGIETSPPTPAETTTLFDKIFRSVDETSQEHGNDSGRQVSQEAERSRTEQNIVLNLRSDSEASAALAEVASRQADGHARLIVKYYAQGHQQAFVTFVSSVVFGIAGFGVVIAACIYLLTHPKDPEPAAISGAVGLVTQGVSYLFFRRADGARSVMLKLIDKLRDDREKETRFIAGLMAGEGIGSVVLRDAVRAATAIQYSGSSYTPEQLSLIAQIVQTAGDSVGNKAPTIYINPISPNGEQAPNDPRDQDSVESSREARR